MVAPGVDFGELGLRHFDDDVPSAERHLPGFAIERDPVPLPDLPTADLSTRSVGADRQLAAAHQTDLAKLTGDHRGMRGASAGGGQDAGSDRKPATSSVDMSCRTRITGSLPAARALA